VLAIDIVGVGPVSGTVRWAQAGKFGVQFGEQFDLGLLAGKQAKRTEPTMLRPLFLDQREAG
jgi:hypothetical protein